MERTMIESASLVAPQVRAIMASGCLTCASRCETQTRSAMRGCRRGAPKAVARPRQEAAAEPRQQEPVPAPRARLELIVREK